MSDFDDFDFHREHDGSLSIESAVFQALGAASTCWEHMEGTGVFDSTRARAIGERLLKFIGVEPTRGDTQEGETR